MYEVEECVEFAFAYNVKEPPVNLLTSDYEKLILPEKVFFVLLIA